MKKNLQLATLWIVAFLLTVAIARFQRMTGPSYPVGDKVTLSGQELQYSFARSHNGETDHPVEIEINDLSAEGFLIWKRFGLDEKTSLVPMKLENGVLKAYLPNQPPAGKLEYQVILKHQGQELIIPADEPIVIRFTGAVPAYFLVPHIAAMFLALFVGMRVALGAPLNLKTKKLSIIALSLIVVGGLMLGPVVQKYAFGVFWAGWPFGGDWTDNKTAVMALGWVIALFRMRKGGKDQDYKWWVVFAALVMFGVYLVPHSIHGSALDYNQFLQDSTQTIIYK